MLFRLVVLIVGLLMVGIGYAQFTNNTERNLPQINVVAVASTAYEPGKVSVKFLPSFSKNIQQQFINAQGNVQFNIPVLDRVLTNIQIKKANSLFSTVLKDVELNYKHQQWGLNRWLVFYFDESIPVASLIKLLESTNAFEVVEPVYNKHLVDADDGATGVNFVPNDAMFSQQWAYKNTGQGNGTAGKDIKLTDAWDIETGKPTVIVSVHDQGIQLNHPDLAQNIAAGKSFNFIDNNSTILQGNHGTHVAGTIAAVNNNGIGVSGIAGGNGNTNSGIRLMSMQVYKGNQSGGHAESFIYAADNGAAISNNSWAYTDPNVYELSVMDAIDYFIANGGGGVMQGGLVIFAAGNLSKPISYYPSAYDRVICVAATNNKDEKANYSTFGTWVDIAAPGGAYGGESDVLSTGAFDGYRVDHGTSMACPHVTGVAALIVSKLQGKISASDVREILLSSTDDIDDINPAFKGQLGTGRLNALKALQKAVAFENGLTTQPVVNFSGSSNCNNINLSWQKNVANNDVIVAYSNTNNIGIPVNGTAYSIGDKLNNSTTIIYKGNANNFSIPNNKSLLHFFKVWGVNNNQYSFGKTYEVVAQAYINASGTVSENFDYPPYFPTQQWRTIDPDNDIGWSHTAGDTSDTGAGDDYSMCMYNYQYNSFEGRVDWLRSPLFNTKGADSLKLVFWHAYQYRNTGLPVSDSLEVLVSTDCGASFNTVFIKGGQNLATVSGTPNTQFYPFGIDKWQKNEIDISQFKTADNILLSFKAVNGKGNNLFIDNIAVQVRYKTDVTPISIEEPFTVNCNNYIVPQVKIKNNGNNTITSLKMNYTVDGANPITTNYTGNIAKDGVLFMALNSSAVTTGNHVLKVFTSLPNNVSDDFVLNDTLTTSFYITTPTGTLPINEGFETSNFPPTNWQVIQSPKDSLTWANSTQASKYGGSKSAMLNNFFYNYPDKRKDDLLTPVIEIAEDADSTFFIYSYAHATKKLPTATAEFDTLEVSISKDCGISWQTLAKRWGSSLQTISQIDVFTTYFVPTINQWGTDSMNITSLVKKGDKLRIRFRNTQNFGNNVYVDDVRLYSKTLPALLKQNGYLVYPNPFGSYVQIAHLNYPVNLKAVRVVNSIGKTVCVQNISGSVVGTTNINLSNVAAGVYSIQLIYDDKIITEKILKIR